MIDAIAALSMDLSSIKTEMSVGTAVTKKVMDQQETEAAGLMKMIEASVPPSNHILDIKV